MDVPIEILDLLSTYGRPVAWVSEITRRRSRAPKSTFRVTFKDGGAAKARLLITEEWARSVEQLRMTIGEDPSLSALLQRRGRAFLEEWVEGQSLEGVAITEGTARWCGANLARLHQAAPSPCSGQSASIRDVVADILGWLSALEASGHLTPQDSAALRDFAMTEAPDPGATAIIHFDFCGENLVLHQGRGPVSIDNETLRMGPPDLDLARALHRWPMPAHTREAFLSGYRAQGGVGTLSHLAFWSLSAEAFSAYVRARDGHIEAAVPVEELRRRVATLLKRKHA